LAFALTSSSLIVWFLISALVICLIATAVPVQAKNSATIATTKDGDGRPINAGFLDRRCLMCRTLRGIFAHTRCKTRNGSSTIEVSRCPTGGRARLRAQGH
jgi:ribosomal protein S27E